MSPIEARAKAKADGIAWRDWCRKKRGLTPLSASTEKPEPAFTVGPKPLYEQQPMPQIGELVEALNTPTDCGYEVSTSGGPRESRTVVYRL